MFFGLWQDRLAGFEDRLNLTVSFICRLDEPFNGARVVSLARENQRNDLDDLLGVVERDDRTKKHKRGVALSVAFLQCRLKPFAAIETKIADRSADKRGQIRVGNGRSHGKMLPQIFKKSDIYELR